MAKGAKERQEERLRAECTRRRSPGKEPGRAPWGALGRARKLGDMPFSAFPTGTLHPASLPAAPPVSWEMLSVVCETLHLQGALWRLTPPLIRQVREQRHCPLEHLSSSYSLSSVLRVPRSIPTFTLQGENLFVS